ncbi:MAG: type III secretion system chaperone [Deltaproteobacteria bacterium]|jgi:hypothetical protein|nr:type III secretion system chaperone [Deltaproteobacteria bacterium]
MDYTNKINDLLRALTVYLNQPSVKLGPDSKASIVIGHCKIIFSFSECGEYLLSQAPITYLPTDQRRGHLLRQLAASNYHSSGAGGLLGLEMATGLIWLTCRYRIDRQKPEIFLKNMAIQTGLAEYWLKTITAPPEEECEPILSTF